VQPDSGGTTPAIKANSVSAVVQEGGEVISHVGQEKTVTINFTTSDGVASALKLQAPDASGWQSADGKLGCDSVSPALSCQLRLRYVPEAPVASTTLKLAFSYTDSTGSQRNDSLAVNYSALAVNAATVSINPAGPVNGIVGQTKAITISFGTNDGSSATSLHTEPGRYPLPAGWSASVPVLDCKSFGGGAACQMQLFYQPSVATGSSSFELPYVYVDSADKAQMASFRISYSALGPNSVAASVAPAGTVVVRPGASRDVTISFSPSDGNAISALKLGTSPLPEGWSIQSSTLPCDQVGSDGKCQLVLRFAPSSSQTQQQLALAYDYVNAIGQAQTGAVTIAYSSRIYSAYVADLYDGGVPPAGGVRQCEVDANGALINCAKVASTWPALTTNRVLLSGSRAYVTTNQSASYQIRSISVCGIDAEGGLNNCADAGPAYDGITSFAILGQNAYLVSPITSSTGSFNRITRCTLNDYGNLQTDSCAQVPLEITGAVVPSALATFKSALYVATYSMNIGAQLLRCTPDPADATKTQCQTFGADYPQSVQSVAGASISGKDYLYLASADNKTGTIVKCSLNADGSISGCDGGKLPTGVSAQDLAQAGEIAIANGQAYIAIAGGNQKGILRCAIDQNSGDLQACMSAGDTGSITPAGISLR
jgi:hypothetical protein